MAKKKEVASTDRDVFYLFRPPVFPQTKYIEMVAALLSGEPHIASRRRTGIVVASDRRACRIARTSLHGHVRELVPWRPSRGLDLAAFARRCVSKKNEERGGGPLRPAGVGDVLSSVASALLLTAAVTLVPLVSQPGVAMADVTDTSIPRTMTDQELQFQQYEQYQKQYKEYQQQQSAYEQMQAKVRSKRVDDYRMLVS